MDHPASSPPITFPLAKARTYLIPRSDAYLDATTHQHTIQLPCANLNDQGRALLLDAQERYDRGDIRGVFLRYYIERASTGPWIREVGETRGYYGNDEVHVVWHTEHNRMVCGELENDESGKRTRTSYCVFITREWALTASGSIYKLGALIE